MVRRIRILVLLLVSGVSVAASGADNSVSANDESHSSLPDLASESAKKEEQENKGKTFKEQGANYFINSATRALIISLRKRWNPGARLYSRASHVFCAILSRRYAFALW